MVLKCFLFLTESNGAPVTPVNAPISLRWAIEYKNSPAKIPSNPPIFFDIAGSEPNSQTHSQTGGEEKPAEEEKNEAVEQGTEKRVDSENPTEPEEGTLARSISDPGPPQEEEINPSPSTQLTSATSDMTHQASQLEESGNEGGKSGGEPHGRTLAPLLLNNSNFIESEVFPSFLVSVSQDCVRLYSANAPLHKDSMSLRKVKVFDPMTSGGAVWSAIIEHPQKERHGFALVLLSEKRFFEIRSLPDLGLLQQGNLGDLLTWQPQEGTSKIQVTCASDGRLIVVRKQKISILALFRTGT